MKIGILTLPLHSNYGGLLQAWALQHTLAGMGHEAIIINRVHYSNTRKRPLWRRILSRVKNELLILSGRRKRYLRVTDELRRLSEKNVIRFRQGRYKGVSPDIHTTEELKEYIAREQFECYIVGSDQVWRPCYSPHLMTYFLDFVKDNSSVKKIAYAASFGVDTWELTPEQTNGAMKLAPLFDVITVRESSAVHLVKEYLKCDSVHVLDPTMLLDIPDYLRLIEDPTCYLHGSDGDLFCYVLDKADAVTTCINVCASTTGYKPFYCNYTTPFYHLKKNVQKQECIVPSVEQWLKSFADAKMVVTDSFHGVVFSIIFNKPFWVIVNSDRGSARFTSLLQLFSLEERMVFEPSHVNWNKPINWVRVNRLRDGLKKNSRSVLTKNL